MVVKGWIADESNEFIGKRNAANFCGNDHGLKLWWKLAGAAFANGPFTVPWGLGEPGERAIKRVRQLFELSFIREWRVIGEH